MFLLIFSTQAIASKSIITKPVVYEVKNNIEVTKNITGYYSNVPGYGEIFFECDANGNDTGYAWVPSNLGTIEKEGDTKLPIDWDNPEPIYPLQIKLEMPNVTTYVSPHIEPGITYGEYRGGVTGNYWEYYIPDKEDRLLIAKVHNPNKYDIKGTVNVGISNQGSYDLAVDIPKNTTKNYFVCYVSDNTYKHNDQDGPSIIRQACSQATYNAQITNIDGREIPSALHGHSFKPMSQNGVFTLPQKYEIAYRVYEMVKECPKCKRENPSDCWTCDCGKYIDVRAYEKTIDSQVLTAIYDPLTSKWDIDTVKNKYADEVCAKLNSILFTAQLNGLSSKNPIRWENTINSKKLTFAIDSASLKANDLEYNMQSGYATSAGYGLAAPVVMDNYIEHNKRWIDKPGELILVGQGTTYNALGTDIRYYDRKWMSQIPLLISEPKMLKKYDYTIKNGVVDLGELKDIECYHRYIVRVDRPNIVIRNGVNSIKINAHINNKSKLSEITWTPENGLNGTTSGYKITKLTVDIDYDQTLVAINPSGHTVKFLGEYDLLNRGRKNLLFYDPSIISPKGLENQKTYLQNVIPLSFWEPQIKQQTGFENKYALSGELEMEPYSTSPIYHGTKTISVTIEMPSQQVDVNTLVNDILKVLNKEYEVALDNTTVIQFFPDQLNRKVVGLGGMWALFSNYRNDKAYGDYCFRDRNYSVIGDPIMAKSYFSNSEYGTITRTQRPANSCGFYASNTGVYNIMRPNGNISLPFYLEK